MAKFGCIGPITTRRRGGPAARRALALVLTAALVFAGVSPAWAVTIEVETEGEGSAPPGSLPGLEEGPGPGGEETVLGEEAPAPADEEGEEEVIAPIEGETPEPEAPAPVEEPQAEVSVAPEAAHEADAPPTYEPEAPPTYEPEAAAPAVVHGEAIVAPAAPRQPGQGGPRPAAQGASETGPAVEAPPPLEAPEPAPSPPATPPAGAAEAPGALRGHRFHTVRPGESLWSIATALLPPGAGNAEIVSEVRRLWRLNAATIGTGDPNLILVGTVLRLH